VRLFKIGVGITAGGVVGFLLVFFVGDIYSDSAPFFAFVALLVLGSGLALLIIGMIVEAVRWGRPRRRPPTDKGPTPRT
jgi:F0F1-type ATP synthase assembly protein I